MQGAGRGLDTTTSSTSLIPPNRAPCDVRHWKTLYPITHAPHHPEVSSRYGFAKSPFRDTEGNLIPDGGELKASYPWIDRNGKNLFFTTVASTLHYFDPRGVLRTRYRSRCAAGIKCQTRFEPWMFPMFEHSSTTRGLAVMGLWTRGKMVLLDSALDNTDYGLRAANWRHRELRLYQSGTGPAGAPSSGWIRVGAGRELSGNALPTISAGNTAFIQSTENLFNYRSQMKPRTPQGSGLAHEQRKGHGRDHLR